MDDIIRPLPVNYSDALGVKTDCSLKNLHDAFVLACFVEHPDRRGGEVAAQIRFATVARAYSTLISPNRRTAYETELKRWPELLPAWVEYRGSRKPLPSWPVDVDMDDHGLLAAYASLLVDAYLLHRARPRRLPILVAVPASLIALLSSSADIIGDIPGCDILREIVCMAENEMELNLRDELECKEKERLERRRRHRAAFLGLTISPRTVSSTSVKDMVAVIETRSVGDTSKRLTSPPSFPDHSSSGNVEVIDGLITQPVEVVQGYVGDDTGMSVGGELPAPSESSNASESSSEGTIASYESALGAILDVESPLPNHDGIKKVGPWLESMAASNLPPPSSVPVVPWIEKSRPGVRIPTKLDLQYTSTARSSTVIKTAPLPRLKSALERVRPLTPRLGSPLKTFWLRKEKDDALEHIPRSKEFRANGVRATREPYPTEVERKVNTIITPVRFLHDPHGVMDEVLRMGTGRPPGPPRVPMTPKATVSRSTLGTPIVEKPTFQLHQMPSVSPSSSCNGTFQQKMNQAKEATDLAATPRQSFFKRKRDAEVFKETAPPDTPTTSCTSHSHDKGDASVTIIQSFSRVELSPTCAGQNEEEAETSPSSLLLSALPNDDPFITCLSIPGCLPVVEMDQPYEVAIDAQVAHGPTEGIESIEDTEESDTTDDTSTSPPEPEISQSSKSEETENGSVSSPLNVAAVSHRLSKRGWFKNKQKAVSSVNSGRVPAKRAALHRGLLLNQIINKLKSNRHTEALSEGYVFV